MLKWRNANIPAKAKAAQLWLVFCGTYKRLLLNRTYHLPLSALLGTKCLHQRHFEWKAKQGQASKLHVPKGTKTLQFQENKKKKNGKKYNTYKQEKQKLLHTLPDCQTDYTQVKVVRARETVAGFRLE